MRSSATKRVALIGMLFALAMVLSFAESALTGALGLPPGVKLGLANVVVMYALLCLGVRDALLLVLLKGLFGLLTRGAVAGALSVTGGLLSLLVLWLLCLLGQKKEYFILSVSAAVAHNAGQLLMLKLLMKSRYTLYYAPVLLISGLGMGTLTALSLKAVLPALEKLGLKR
ncbi:MAG: Gx transporter family protein [Ruthenibacterium sp.]